MSETPDTGQSRPGSSADAPVSVSTFNDLLGNWIERCGTIWVEGELSAANYQSNWHYAFLTLCDMDSDAIVQVLAPGRDFQQWDIAKGDHVVVYGHPNFYRKRGEFRFMATEIKKVGLGQLLEEIEKLRRTLYAEGLCAPERKKKLPFLPNKVGLITGKDSAAQQDVMRIATERWPEVSFRVINTQVQGSLAVPQVMEALALLDADPEVDVIIIARGGGSLEDLLPFSREPLARAVAAAQTPVVSAIGHEPDNPVLDDVADVRAATPTHAAKIVVPDVAEEREILRRAHESLNASLRNWVERERSLIEALRSRPVLAQPLATIERFEQEVDFDRGRALRALSIRLDSEEATVRNLAAQVNSLGPTATLSRGYAIVQVGNPPGEIVETVDRVQPGSQLRIRVLDGAISAATLGVEKKK
ncbi:MAG: exodeoxyribonuclease VII large subunit [Corynebacterium sp.]|nr:exodeoxyribonuclease VII large subunit [Corynebacterium sp.]